MNIAFFALTRNGVKLSETLAASLSDRHICRRYCLEKYADDGCVTFTDLRQAVAAVFGQCDALVFLCACGIAVRMIAPLVVSKITDPAVVAVDERGRFAVSLLSGHLGGGNALTRRIADVIGAEAVITTATDAGGRFSPDCFAAANHLHICEMNAAKEVAAAAVNGEMIGLDSDYPYTGKPDDLTENRAARCGVCISADTQKYPFATTLHLVPQNIILGVGCKKNTSPDLLERFIMDTLSDYGIPLFRVCELHTIDLKKDEKAIADFCRKYRLPLKTYPPKTLMNVKGDFASSDFVLRTTGTDNVCERSAAADGGTLIVPKQARDGMTLAAAERELLLDFERSLL